MVYDAGLAVPPPKTPASVPGPLGWLGVKELIGQGRRGGRVSGMAVIRVEALGFVVCCHGGASMSLRLKPAGHLARVLNPIGMPYSGRFKIKPRRLIAALSGLGVQ